jgi:geranylgeranyl diphosphate synthase type 3
MANMLGIHFQIRDDYINLISDDFHDKKGFAEDLTEGKFSFPIIHCIHSDPIRGKEISGIELLTFRDFSKETNRS